MAIVRIIKRCALLFVMSLVIFQTSGCATMEAVQKDLTSFWKNLKATLSEKQGGSRSEAVQKYGYKGHHDEIFADAPALTPTVAKPGDNMRYELQYAVLSPQRDKRFVVSETVVLSGGGETTGLAQKKAEKPQGSHILTIEFEIPKDLDPGRYKIVTTISCGHQKKTVQVEFAVRK